MGITRAEVRRMVAHELDDVRYFAATSVAEDAATLIDEERAIMENGTFAGRECVATSGANQWERRTVQSNSRQTRALIFWSAWPNVFAVGDAVHAFNHRGNGWRIDQYDDGINRVLADLGAGMRVAIVEENAVASFDPHNPAVAIPDDFVFLEGVQFGRWNGQSNDWVEIDAAAYPGGAGWFVEEGTGTVSVGGTRWQGAARGRPVRLIGRGTPALLYADDDETRVHPRYLVPAVAATLLRAGMHRQYNAERERLLGLLDARLDRLYPSANPRLGPNAVRVR